jgi:hypothetical protein
LKDFWEPMSVGVKVVLSVEGNTMGKHLHPYVESRTLRVHTCMYTMVMDSSTKRWTFTLTKFDEPFGARFYFERFLGTGVGWCEGRTLG